MLDTRDIHPMTDFLRNHKAHLQRMKDNRAPEVLTINGRAEAVIMDTETFEEMSAKIARIEAVEAIREGLASAERGELKPAEQVFDEIRARYGLPR